MQENTDSETDSNDWNFIHMCHFVFFTITVWIIHQFIKESSRKTLTIHLKRLIKHTLGYRRNIRLLEEEAMHDESEIRKFQIEIDRTDREQKLTEKILFQRGKKNLINNVFWTKKVTDRANTSKECKSSSLDISDTLSATTRTSSIDSISTATKKGISSKQHIGKMANMKMRQQRKKRKNKNKRQKERKKAKERRKLKKRLTKRFTSGTDEKSDDLDKKDKIETLVGIDEIIAEDTKVRTQDEKEKA